MKILINSDKTIHSSASMQDNLKDILNRELTSYQTKLSRIDVHLTDQNGVKEGVNDILCLIEAHIDGRPSTLASQQADTLELAFSAALDHLVSSLERDFGRNQH